jgi:hypothetical protein
MPAWRRAIALPLIAAAAAVCTTARRAETPAPVAAAVPNFDRTVRPVLERQCRPCHFEGGIMYGKLPFDRAETIRTLGERLFTRIRHPEDQAKIRAFLQGR